MLVFFQSLFLLFIFCPVFSTFIDFLHSFKCFCCFHFISSSLSSFFAILFLSLSYVCTSFACFLLVSLFLFYLHFISSSLFSSFFVFFFFNRPLRFVVLLFSSTSLFPPFFYSFILVFFCLFFLILVFPISFLIHLFCLSFFVSVSSKFLFLLYPFNYFHCVHFIPFHQFSLSNPTL